MWAIVIPASIAFLLAAGTAFALDRATKAWMRRRLAATGAPPPGSLLRPVWNRHPTLGGAASRRRLAVGWLAAAAASAALVALEQTTGTPLAAATSPGALGAAVGGAAGNLRDRWRHGAVLDFVDLRALVDRPPFGVCNLADAAIVGGLLLFAAGEVLA